jgi:hypothetical protein
LGQKERKETMITEVSNPRDFPDYPMKPWPDAKSAEARYPGHEVFVFRRTTGGDLVFVDPMTTEERKAWRKAQAEGKEDHAEPPPQIDLCLFCRQPIDHNDPNPLCSNCRVGNQAKQLILF